MSDWTMDKLNPRPVVRSFAREMERALQCNDFKGGWHDDTIGALFHRLEQEVEELRAACGFRCRCCGRGPQTKAAVDQLVREAADVANFAMMIADVAGGLKPRSTGVGP